MQMGLFAFTVALISLLRLGAEREFFRLRLMKRIFGRKNGLVLHFLVNVVLPLVMGVVFFCSGLSGGPSIPSLIVDNPLPDSYQQVAPAEGNSSIVGEPLVSA